MFLFPKYTVYRYLVYHSWSLLYIYKTNSSIPSRVRRNSDNVWIEKVPSMSDSDLPPQVSWSTTILQKGKKLCKYIWIFSIIWMKKTCIKLAKKSAINVTLGAGNKSTFLYFRALCSRKPLLGGDQKHSLYKIMQYFEAAAMYLSI